eukprot:CAMPEP_0174943904 /NCGR_PEP_ID=MMETSP1355-20121228/77875_1 /TAXON_ID=464990 /ORGANISM="Hemiselmis tepida, Strain CCMP443" /LENGTH=43 /DNA_ID= /DNA_START= /DNA_END= /DNA_ORIENTATION=
MMRKILSGDVLSPGHGGGPLSGKVLSPERAILGILFPREGQQP